MRIGTNLEGTVLSEEKKTWNNELDHKLYHQISSYYHLVVLHRWTRPMRIGTNLEGTVLSEEKKHGTMTWLISYIIKFDFMNNLFTNLVLASL